jgi:hypothetical protein
MPFEDYLAIPAFSASDALTLLRSFPARIKHVKPRTQALDDGRIAHRLVLEGVDEIEDSRRYIVTPKGFSMAHVNKHAELIQRIEAEGLEPISEDRAANIRGMHEALKRDPVVMQAFSNGRAEVSAFWLDPEFGIPCKARFDWLPNKGSLLPDYKTAASIDDDELGRSVKNYGTAHRSAHYADAATITAGMEWPIYLPVWQEKTAPYFVVMRPVESTDIDLARLELGKAKAIWRQCHESGVWPGPEHFRPIELPGWERKRLENEYMTERAMALGEPEDKAFAA